MNHTLPSTNFSKIDEDFAVQWTAQVERMAYLGNLFNTGAPSPFSYESYFPSGYDFSASTLQIDAGAVTTVALQNAGLGFDVSFSGGSGGANSFQVGFGFSIPLNDFGLDFNLFGPVILNLSGGGINITPRQDSNVFIDVDNDGYLERTAWAGPGDGILVIDLGLNNQPGPNGVINQALEFAFSNWTEDPNDTDVEALAARFDTNQNGLLDPGDARWGEFRVWSDVNQTGYRDNTQVQTLAALGITSITLTTDHQAFGLPDGSRINGIGTFTRHGVANTFADASLAYDTAGFKRVTKPFYGYDYVTEGGGTKAYFDARTATAQGGGSLYDFPFDGDTQGYDGVFGSSQADIIKSANSKPVTIFGDLGNDVIWGGYFLNDVLDGGPNADTIFGFGGDDTLYIDFADLSGQPVQNINGGAGYDTAIFTTNAPIQIALGLHELESLIANEQNDTITGNPGAAAYIDGRGGNDTITGAVYGDTLVGGTGSDTLYGMDGADLLSGGADADRLEGGNGDDVLIGGLGNDLMYGGSGNDTYILDSTADLVSENANEGTDTVNASVSYALTPNVENLVLLEGTAATNGTGNALNNTITGNSNNNWLDGGTGADTMAGGAGDDTYIVETAGEAVVEDANAGNDTVYASVTFDELAANVEDLVLVESAGAIFGIGNGLSNRITGNSATNSLVGGGGNDTLLGGGAGDDLEGGAGADVIDGGEGFDFARYDGAALGIYANLLTPSLNNGEAAGDIYVSIEGLVGSAYDDILEGDNAANMLVGLAGNDYLGGNGGADTMIGGSGDDTYYVHDADDVVVEDANAGNDTVRAWVTFALAANVEDLVLVEGAGAIHGAGNGLSNRITGNSAYNSLVGGGGNDTLLGGGAADDLNGGAGADVLDGGDGFDYARYDGAAVGIYANLLTPSLNNGEAAGDTYVSIEGLVGSAWGDILAGDNAANTLFGLDGNDGLVGNGGNDTLYGGAGNDVLRGGAGADYLNGGDGVDAAHYEDAVAGVYANLLDPTVNNGDAAGDTYVSIENLTGTAYADILVGDDAVNALYGLDGNDRLAGYGGNDTLYGGAGNDVLRGGAGADYLNGGDGVDAAYYDAAAAGVYANLLNPSLNNGEAAGDTYVSVENLTGSLWGDILAGDNAANALYGLDGNDGLVGNGGNDTLYGGAGNDVLRGGAGADILDGGDGVDGAHYEDAAAGVYASLLDPTVNNGDAAGDTYVSVENLTGSAYADILVGDAAVNALYGLDGNDRLVGNGGNDSLDGGAGNDVLLGGAGADTLNGGAGIDTADYDGAVAGVYAALSDPSVNNGDAAGDIYVSVENLSGSAAGDILVGDNNANVLTGLASGDYLIGNGGNDTLDGGAGADYLAGGAGADYLAGGAGDDLFVFAAGEANGDTLADFAGNGAAAGDQLQFSGYGSAAAGATFTQVDATHWSINSANGLIHDIVTMQSGVTVHQSDYAFV